MELAIYITAFFTLFVVIDPIGLAPLFVAMTNGMTPAQRRAIGVRACVTGAGILTVFGFFGEAVLGGIGIGMPAFRISGGILLFLTALDMLFDRRTKRRQDQSENDAPTDDPSIFPLAMPLIAGPGAMATMILLAGQGNGALDTLAFAAVMLAVVGCVFVMFLLATPIERLLGDTGTNVVTRLMGMLLAALSVQFVLDGLEPFIHGL